MKPHNPTELGRAVMRFFEVYLPTLRGMSAHTIRSYRDALVLFLRFAARDARRRVEQLTLANFDGERMMRFLSFLETERHNGIATRNARLAALHTFARFLASEHPEHLARLQAILAIPFKRGGREAPIEYFESREMKALMRGIDRTASFGPRDYALFALMFNTGARVQEILDLRVRDLRLDAPQQVRLHGKGNKVRQCPIWPGTAKLLRALIEQRRRSAADPGDVPVFVNGRGAALTRFGVRYLLRKHLAICATDVASLRDKRLHPHSLRHTTAIHLLKAGVDVVTISHWLGHAHLNTTMRYARADIDLKRQALAQVFPDVLAAPRGGRVAIDGANLTSWLRRL